MFLEQIVFLNSSLLEFVFIAIFGFNTIRLSLYLLRVIFIEMIKVIIMANILATPIVLRVLNQCAKIICIVSSSCKVYRF